MGGKSCVMTPDMLFFLTSWSTYSEQLSPGKDFHRATAL